MEDYTKEAEIFKALGDANRLKILSMLKGGEKCACKILEELGIGQPTLSHHMKILCSAGLVKGRKEGRWVHYVINGECRAAWLKMFVEMTDVREGALLCSCKEEDNI